MIRALLTIGAIQGATLLVLLLRTKTLAVALGPELVGLLALIDRLAAVFTQTAALSLPFAAARFLPPLWEAGDGRWGATARAMRNLMAGTVGLAMAVGVTVAFGAPRVFGADLVEHRASLVAVFLCLPALAGLPFLQSVVAGRFAPARAMLVGLGQAAALAVAAGAGATLGGLPGFYLLFAVLGTGVLIAGWRLAMRRVEGRPPAGRPFALPPLVGRFSATFLVIAFLAPFAALRVFHELIQRHGAVAGGWAQAGIGLALAVRAVLGASHAVFLTPNVNREASPAERMAWADRYQQAQLTLAAVAAPPLLLFSDWAVRLLYSAEFGPGSGFVALFVGAELVGLLAGTYQAIVVAYDHLRFSVLQNVVAQGALLAAGIGLVPPLGVLGLALAQWIPYLVLLVTTLVFLRHRHGVAPRPPVVLFALMVFAVVALSGTVGVLIPTDGWRPALAKLAMAAALGAGVLAMLTREERRRVLIVLRWRSGGNEGAA